MEKTDRPLLIVEDLSVNRPGAEVLRGVNLTLWPAEVHVLLGLNGSGKTSLALTLMGCAGYTPARGRILFDGEDITYLPVNERARRGITLAWQEPARFEGLLTGDYLALGVRGDGNGGPSVRERVEEALRAVALAPAAYLARPVDQSLSGGERKRIELAAVYAMRPRLAILDEPDSGIDVLCQDEIVRLIRRMADEGTAVLLITHRDEMAAAADQASLICGGVVVKTGDPEEVRAYFAQRCRPHEESLGAQPWEVRNGDAYKGVVTQRVCQ